MIYLIGLNHKYQLEGYKSAWELFYDYLSSNIKGLNIDLIAEELSEDSINQFSAKGSVAKRIAIEHGCRHIFVDPGMEERERLGIKGFKEIAHEMGYGSVIKNEDVNKVVAEEKRHWAKRESLWLEKIQEDGFNRCLFILGAKHISRFPQLLAANGIESEILIEDFKNGHLETD